MFLLSERSIGSFRARLRKPPRAYDEVAAMRGEQTASSSLQYEWKMGARRPAHLIWTDGMGVLLSTEFVAAIHGLTGWSSIPVSMLLPQTSVADNYCQLVVTGRCGHFEPQRTIKLPAGSDRAWDLYKGLCFGESETGADICMPRERLNFIFVSDAFSKVVATLAGDVAETTPCEEVLTQPWTYASVVEKTLRA
jgi:hypothetical protein